MKVIKLFLVTMVLTAFVISPLMAGGYNGSQKNKAGQKRCGMMGLDNEHAAELQKLKVKSEQNAIDLRANIKKIHLKMKVELLDDNPDLKSLEELAEKLASAKGELHKNRIRFLFDAKKVLPEKEWKLFLKKHMNMECGMGGCHNQMGHGGRSGSMKRSPRHSMGRDYGACKGAAGKGCKLEATRKCLKEIKE